MKNLITDVPGIRVGHATDAKLGSGATAVIFDEPSVAAVDVRGGGPGTRETDLLAPATSIDRIDAVALSGGSAFGLEAGSGVAAWLAEQGRGFVVGSARVPLVPGAILFDLLGPGEKSWGRFPPYRELGYAAAAAATADFALGSVGAGTGATTQNLKGGLGSASARTPSGHIVGALAAVNAAGRVTVGDGPHFWAAPFEVGSEFGGRGLPSPLPPEALAPRMKGQVIASTTLCVVATDAALTQPQAARLATMAQCWARAFDRSDLLRARRRHRICGGNRPATGLRCHSWPVRDWRCGCARARPRRRARHLRSESTCLPGSVTELAGQVRRVIPKSGNRFSEKITRKIAR